MMSSTGGRFALLFCGCTLTLLAACTGLKSCQNEVKAPSSDLPAHARKAIEAWKSQDAKTLSDLIHPEKGVRFSPYATVDPKFDIVFSKAQMADFFSDTKSYEWGAYDGTGDPISMTPTEYYNAFIYNADFANATTVSIDKIVGRSNALENMTEVYPYASWVEFFMPGTNPELDGMDWQGLRLVFERSGEVWYLVAVIHNQWTI